VVGLWNLELFPVNWILRFEVDFVFKILGKNQVVLIDAEGILVFAQDIKISVMEFLWDLQVTLPFDFFPGQSFPLHFWKAVVDILANYNKTSFLVQIKFITEDSK
jgi:hypothetical protein